MNCKTLLFVPLVLSSGIAAATPDLSEYSIAFSDEFNGLTLDSDKWNTGYLWGPYLPINNEEQLYVDINGMHAGATHNPFELTGESLIIRATPTTGEIQPPVRPDETDSIWDGYPEYRFNGPDAETGDPGYRPEDINYLSGLITSYESFRFTHGYAETRVKLPKGQGLWPAFWLSTSFYVEDVPEIDIMEFLGHDVETIYHTYHYFEPLNNWRQISTPSYTTQGQDFTADWHTYSVSWGPKEIVWYVDGVETRRITDDEYTIANQAMYVLANLAVGGDWPGSPDETTVFPAEYEIDYIRVYEKNPPPAITQSVLDEEYQLMFSDEFNGSSLDTDKWNTHHLWGPYWQINNELQFYPDVGDTHAGIAQSPLSFENFSDGSRGLVITAREIASNELPPLPAEDSADFDAHPEWRNNLAYNDPNYVKIPQGQEGYVAGAADAPFLPEYSSGIITTYDSFKFVNGYAEIRAKLPEGSGLWPAFWLLNGYYVDQQPEIDIIETRGENPAEAVHSYHMYQPDGTLQSDSFSTFANNGENFTDNFHTYGIAWSPGKLDWYVDGVKVGDSLTGPTVSSQVMYAIINLAVGGNFVGDVGAEAVPNEMLVDYIRIYQQDVNLPVSTTEPPEIPQVFIPAADSQQPISETLVYQWNDSGGAEEYDFLLFNRNTNSVQYRAILGSDAVCANGLCELIMTPENQLPVGNKHVWRVASINAAGRSELTYTLFDVIDDGIEPPELPQALFPLADSQQPISETLVYQWQESAGAEEYDFLLFNRNTNSVQYRAILGSDAVCANGLCELIMTPENQLPVGNKHVWRVASINAAGRSELTYTLFDVIDDGIEPPELPQALFPLADSQQPISETVVYRWNDSGGAEEYDFLLFNRNTNSVQYRAILGSDAVCANGLCELIMTPENQLPVGNKHVWRVASINAAGRSELTYTLFDVIDDGIEPPELPQALFPLADSQQPISETLVYRWNDSGGAEEYDFLLFNRNTNSVQYRAILGSDAVCANGLCELIMTPENQLPVGNKHVWRVASINAAGRSELTYILFDVVGE